MADFELECTWYLSQNFSLIKLPVVFKWAGLDTQGLCFKLQNESQACCLKKSQTSLNILVRRGSCILIARVVKE